MIASPKIECQYSLITKKQKQKRVVSWKRKSESRPVNEITNATSVQKTTSLRHPKKERNTTAMIDSNIETAKKRTENL